MADGRHFENSFIAISRRKSSDFNEISYEDADCASKVGYLTKIPKFCKYKMAVGRHIENGLLAISQRVIIRSTRNFAG